MKWIIIENKESLNLRGTHLDLNSPSQSPRKASAQAQKKTFNRNINNVKHVAKSCLVRIV